MQTEPVSVLFSTRLNWQEILLLDGHCREEIQRDIDLVKQAQEIQSRYPIDMASAVFISRAKNEAHKKGKLVCRPVKMHFCPVTGAKSTYLPSKKRDRYGIRKPDIEVLLQGCELKDSFVSVQGYPSLGISLLGLEQIRIYLASEMRDIPAQVPERLIGEPCGWIYEEKLKCVCGWSGRKSFTENRDPFWFGFKCPSCGGRESSSVFTSKLFKQDGFEVVSRTQIELETLEAKNERKAIEENQYAKRKLCA